MPVLRSLVMAPSSITLPAFAGTAMGHITVRPTEAPAGAITTYTVRVPTEGAVTTSAVELILPEGMTLLSVRGETGSHEIKSNGGTTAIVWKAEIPPGQQAEFTFTATNPATGTEIVWKAFQLYQDGTRAEWVEPKGSKRPAPVTTLIP